MTDNRRDELVLSRPEQILVRKIKLGYVEDHLKALAHEGWDLRGPLYDVAPDQDATYILLYLRTDQVWVVDDEAYARRTLNIPQRSDGCVALSKDHIEGILDLESSNICAGFDNNTVASIKVKGTAFRIQGESGCIDPRAYDSQLGSKYAKQAAIDNLFPLEGYALARLLGLAGITTEEPGSKIQTGYSFDGRSIIRFPSPPVADAWDWGLSGRTAIPAYDPQPSESKTILETVSEHDPEEPPLATEEIEYVFDDAEVKWPKVQLYSEVLTRITREAEIEWSATEDNGGDRMQSAVGFLSAHQYLTDREMGTYLIDLNGLIQGVTQNRAMFFQCTAPGRDTPLLVLMNKTVGATMYPGDNGYIRLPADFPLQTRGILLP